MRSFQHTVFVRPDKLSIRIDEDGYVRIEVEGVGPAERLVVEVEQPRRIVWTTR